MRYERKYKIERFGPEVTRQLIAVHPASFRKTYPDRKVNNIYYDTATMAAYQENVDGVANRRKFRVRWYGEDIRKIENPRLEIKVKSNQLGYKEVYPVDDFSLDDLSAINRAVSGKTRSLNILQPTLINSYLRSYFATSNGKFRLTIDRKLQYFSLLNARTFTRFQIEEPATIVEVKYDESLDDEADFILRHLPFRFSKSSKYVTGLDLTVGSVF